MSIPSPWLWGDVSFSCRRCADGETYESWRRFEDHVAWEHFQLAINCKHCPRICTDVYEMNEHRAWRHLDERPFDEFYDRQHGWFEKRQEINDFIRFNVQTTPLLVLSPRHVQFAMQPDIIPSPSPQTANAGIERQSVFALNDCKSIEALEALLRRGFKISRVVGDCVLEDPISVHSIFESLYSYQLSWRLTGLSVNCHLDESDLVFLSGVMTESMATLKDVKFGENCDLSSLTALLTKLSRGKCDKLRNLLISCDGSYYTSEKFEFPELDTVDGLNVVLTCYVKDRELLWRLADIFWYRDVISIQSLGCVGEKEPYCCIRENSFEYEPLNIQEIFPISMFEELRYFRLRIWDPFNDGERISYLVHTFPKLTEVVIDGCLNAPEDLIDYSVFASCFRSAHPDVDEWNRQCDKPVIKIFVKRQELAWNENLVFWQRFYDQVSVDRFYPFKAVTSKVLKKEVLVHTIVYLRRAIIVLFR